MFLLLSASSAKAQVISDFNNLYVNAEIGKIKGYQNFAQGGVYAQIGHHYFKIKYAAAANNVTAAQNQSFDHYQPDCDCTSDFSKMEDISFMYGKSYRFLNFNQIQFATGLSVFVRTAPGQVYNRERESYELTSFKKSGTVGLPAEIRYSLQFKRYFAISCTASVNANFVKSYGVISAGIALGLL